MITTAKETHVYIENTIQNVSSNRKQSIHPKFIDMVLNNAVIEYVSSKFPDKQQPRDIEATLKRYTDFNILKTPATRLLEVGTGIRPSVFTKIPSNCLKLQAAVCNYKRPSTSSDTEIKNKYSVLLIFDESLNVGSTLILSFSYTNAKGITVSESISFNDIISSISTKEGLFYLYDNVIDRLRNVCNLDCSFATNGVTTDKVISIEFPVGTSLHSFTSNTAFVRVHTSTSRVTIVKENNSRTSAISILSSYECQVTLDDYYGHKNLHLNPIAELINGNLEIYYTDFIPSKVEIHYIRKPKLFNINTGQVPEISITKDFLDFAIKEFLLILNSPSFEKVVNQNVKNL